MRRERAGVAPCASAGRVEEQEEEGGREDGREGERGIGTGGLITLHTDAGYIAGAIVLSRIPRHTLTVARAYVRAPRICTGGERVCTRRCARALACSGHVDDVGASLCGRTIIQRARGWIVESGRGRGRGRESRRTTVCGGSARARAC